PVYRGCHSSFPYLERKCDDSNTPKIDQRPVGAVPVLHGGLALELSPCARSAQDSDPLPCREDLVSSRERMRRPVLGRHHRAVVRRRAAYSPVPRPPALELP